MTVITTEVEIAAAFPADKLFKVIVNFDTLAPKVAPQVFKSISIVEGDGGVGTIKKCIHGDAVPYTTSIQKVDAVDVSNLSVSYTIYEGDALFDFLDSITHHIKISPGVDGGSVYKHTTVFNCKGEATVPEEMLTQTNEGYKKVFKAIEAHVLANVDAY
ncbi:hypothetical protein L6452_18741 [Arctium lappa]|uniref:Uncharacterized protein n=1 Tax=Arctium lappa TaxID=4217 RepID=A0ACB9C755_ARCLA|nr:hypothetical protein L6452_18741 [Arctium lappa]